MATQLTSTVGLITASEFGRMPDPGYPTELVKGRIVRMSPPSFRHGLTCGNIYFAIRQFLQRNDLGRVVSNDSGVVTERDPDTVRGADVAFYGYERLPREATIDVYPDVPPDAAFEVRSPSEGRGKLLEKVAEYLNAGVTVVCVLDPETETIVIYRADVDEVRLSAEQELSLPDVLPGFTCRVASLFAAA
jgi:Uma2 family endonuclease